MTSARSTPLLLTRTPSGALYSRAEEGASTYAQNLRMSKRTKSKDSLNLQPRVTSANESSPIQPASSLVLSLGVAASNLAQRGVDGDGAQGVRNVRRIRRAHDRCACRFNEDVRRSCILEGEAQVFDARSCERFETSVEKKADVVPRPTVKRARHIHTHWLTALPG